MGTRLLYWTAMVAVLASIWIGPAQAELVGWWTFDGNYDDVSGNGHNGTPEGDPTFAEGQYGQAVEFNGDDWINCGTGLTFTTLGDGGTVTGCSMTFWVNRSAEGDHKICGDVDDPGWTGGGGIKAAIYNNLLEVDMRDSDQRYFSRDDATPPTGTAMGIDTWYHIAVVFDDEADTMLIYLDGVVDRSLTVTQGMAASTIEWRIGTDTPNVGHYANGLVDDLRLYDHALSEREVLDAMQGRGPSAELAGDPYPIDEATDVPRDVSLVWAPGVFADTHDVYLGTSFEDVNAADRANPGDVLLSQSQSDTIYDLSGLEFGQTYYWRVDEVNGAPDNAIFKGEVWSLTVEPFAYAVANVIATSNGISDAGVGPENMVNGSGINEDDEHSTVAADMWLATPGAEALQVQYEFDAVYKLHEMLVWNYNVQFELMLGFGLKDVTVEYSENGTDWAALGDVQFAQGTAKADYAANTAVAFDGVAAKYVRLTVTSGYGPMGQFGLSEVRFMFIPVQAREPQPVDGQTEVLVGTTLSWRAGREAVTHDVYLGTAPEALALADSVSEAGYAPGDLQLGAMYYWQIVEVNEAEAISSWAGDVWSFATQEYAVIDDMEGYDDEENRIFDTWLDGFVNATGATVGYFDAPFAERSIVNSGSQSMPLEYANDAAPFYSEAELDVGSADWTAGGADSLRLYVQGSPDNGAGALYVAVEDSAGNVAVVTHPGGAVLTTDTWQAWLIPYSELGGINLNRVALMYIGVGDRDNPSAGGSGLILIDDIGYGHSASVD